MLLHRILMIAGAVLAVCTILFFVACGCGLVLLLRLGWQFARDARDGPIDPYGRRS